LVRTRFTKAGIGEKDRPPRFGIIGTIISNLEPEELTSLSAYLKNGKGTSCFDRSFLFLAGSSGTIFFFARRSSFRTFPAIHASSFLVNKQTFFRRA